MFDTSGYGTERGLVKDMAAPARAPREQFPVENGAVDELDRAERGAVIGAPAAEVIQHDNFRAQVT